VIAFIVAGIEDMLILLIGYEDEGDEGPNPDCLKWLSSWLQLSKLWQAWQDHLPGALRCIERSPAPERLGTGRTGLGPVDE